MYQLKVILATTREGRKGTAVAAWFMNWLKGQQDFEAVHIPFFAHHINDDGEFIPTEFMEKSAEVMMKELLKWTKGLKAMREAEK